MYKILIKTLFAITLPVLAILAMEEQADIQDLVEILKIKPTDLFYEALPIIKKYNEKEIENLEIDPTLQTYALKLKRRINEKLLWSIITDKAIEVLLNFGGDINFQDELGITPLYRAAADIKYERVKLLLDRGANPNLRLFSGADAFAGMNVLMRVASRLRTRLQDEPQLLKIAALLIKNKADVNAVDANNNSALSIAAMALSDKMVQLLLEHGANPNIESIDHLTPLMRVVELKTTEKYKQRQLNVILMLIKYGANLFKQNAEGETAYDLATKKGNTEVANILKDAMQKRG